MFSGAERSAGGDHDPLTGGLSLSALRALAAASIVIPLLFLCLAARQSYQQHMHEAESTVRRGAEIVGEQVLRVLEVHDLVIGRVDDRVSGMSWDEISNSEDLHRWLLQLDESLPTLDVIWLIDPGGKGRNSSRYFPAPSTSRVADRDYFAALKENDTGSFIGEPRPGRSTAGLFFNVARRRTAPGGAFDGLIVTSLNPAYFAEALNGLTLSPDDSFSVIRDDGTGLARGPQPLQQPMRLSSESGFLRAIRGGTEAPYRSVAQLDGIERLYWYMKLPGYPVYVSFGRSVGAVLAAWYRDLMLYSGLAVASAGALSAMTFLAMRRTRQQLVAAARLRDSEARYQMLFRDAPVGLLLARVGPEGSLAIEEINPALASITGLARDRVVGQSPGAAFEGEIGASVEDHYRQSIASKQPVEYEVQGDGPTGRYVRRAIVRPILDESGEVTKVLGTSMDITESRRLEEQLRRAQKMEALAALVSGVAHDFNNLLTVIMGNLDLARRAKDDRRPRLIENAIQAVEQGRKLTAQLLAFGRGQVLQVEFVDIPQLITSTHQMLAQSLRGDISIDIDLAEDLWPVRVDPSQLQVALINLAANARDAMPNGGMFSVTAENIVLQDGRLSEAVAIAVSDTGIGIPRDVLSRIFEPFFTTKEVGKGSGLGLAQVYSFAQQSGGSVDVRSEEGRGTTVTLYLPKAPAHAERTTPSHSRKVESGGPKRKLKVLLVEDNADVAEVGRTLLTERGHRVRVCGSAGEGLQALDEEQFDAVCSDLVMPGGQNGLDLARIVRQRMPDVPVILMTGYSEAAGAAIEDGFTLLTKPYDPSELAAAVENAEAGTASRNVVPFSRQSQNRADK